MVGLFFTLLLGLFILLGTMIVFFTKNNDRVILFSLSTAFGVMMTLIIFELIPEAFESFQTSHSMLSSFFLIVLFAIIGLLLLKGLDHFIPDHDTKMEEKHHLFHIGLVSSIALILHNIIEGMSVYSAFLSSDSLGLLISLGVGLHNIPMGMVLASVFYRSIESKKKTMLISLIISLSTFLGGCLLFVFQDILNEVFLGICLSLTLGMLLYITIFELWPQLKEAKDKKLMVIGIIIGILVLFISISMETIFG